MSGIQSQAAGEAMETNLEMARRYAGIALPTLRGTQEEINRALGAGQPEYLRSAFEGQRGAITEGLAAKGGVASAQQAAGSKKALSGGNFNLGGVDPAAFGAQLANALYGSRFAEGQANLDQTFNLIGMGLGGAGTAGSGALGAAQQQLQAINYLPQYNQTYANVVGGLAGGASIYGALQNAWSNANPQLQGNMMWGGLPQGTSYGPTIVGPGRTP